MTPTPSSFPTGNSSTEGLQDVDRRRCEAMDAQDPLRLLRKNFSLPSGQIYLDGNSLGVLPSNAAARVNAVVTTEWGRDLIQSWNTASWIDLPTRVGDKIGRLIGARPSEVVACDSTSVNLFKALSVLIALQRAADASGQRRVILSERENFPTDLYIAEQLARANGMEIRWVEHDEIPQHLNDSLAVVMLTQVNYRTGRLLDMAALSRAAHAVGALVVWDLAHSAGALDVQLHGTGRADDAADMAVGCGYKYLNGGPGAPAFIWAHPRILARMTELELWQPLSGWMGHAAPFAFETPYRPAPGMAAFLCGTPQVVAMSCLECGVDTVLSAQAVGGMAAIRAKSLALTDLFIRLVEERCVGIDDLSIHTPRVHAERGSQVSLLYPPGAYAVIQALIEKGVVGDFRSPGVMRFGFTPLYVRYVDVWDAVEALREILASGSWRQDRFQKKAVVT